MKFVVILADLSYGIGRARSIWSAIVARIYVQYSTDPCIISYPPHSLTPHTPVCVAHVKAIQYKVPMHIELIISALMSHRLGAYMSTSYK